MLRPLFMLVVLTLVAPAIHAAGEDEATVEHFEKYLADCGEHEIRCVWFLDDHPRVGMVMTFDLSKPAVYTVREVFSWAEQNSEARKLSHYQELNLRKIIEQMPPSDDKIEFNRAVSISFQREGKVETYRYDRRDVPPAVVRLYDIGGGYLDQGEEDQKEDTESNVTE